MNALIRVSTIVYRLILFNYFESRQVTALLTVGFGTISFCDYEREREWLTYNFRRILNY